jgi:hypothetical protein
VNIDWVMANFSPASDANLPEPERKNRAVNNYHAWKAKQDQEAMQKYNAERLGIGNINQVFNPQQVQAIMAMLGGGQVAPGAAPGTQTMQPAPDQRQGDEWDINETQGPSQVQGPAAPPVAVPTAEELAGLTAAAEKIPAEKIHISSASDYPPCSYCGKNGQAVTTLTTPRMERHICGNCQSRAFIHLFDNELKPKQKRKRRTRAQIAREAAAVARAKEEPDG